MLSVYPNQIILSNHVVKGMLSHVNENISNIHSGKKKLKETHRNIIDSLLWTSQYNRTSLQK